MAQSAEYGLGRTRVEPPIWMGFLAAKQQPDGLSVSTYMEPDDPAGSAALRWLDPAMDATQETAPRRRSGRCTAPRPWA